MTYVLSGAIIAGMADSHPAAALGPAMYAAPEKPADHPLCRELHLMARRSDQDPCLKERYLGFRKEVMAALGRKVPGLVGRLVANESERLVALVLDESRQWREAGEWSVHRQHLRVLRSAAHMHLFLTSTGMLLAED